MSGNSFGLLYCVTSFGESHGPAYGGVVDGCPPGMELSAADIQKELDRRKPGSSRHVTQRRESDAIEILSGVYQGRTTGTAIGFLIRNEDQRSKDYSAIAEKFRPGHADYTYLQKYGVRDARGGGRASARETVVRVAGGAIAKKWLRSRYGVEVRGYLAQLGRTAIPFESWEAVDGNPFFAPNPGMVAQLEKQMDELRESGDSCGARVNVVNGLGDATINLTCSPDVQPGQRVSLALGDREVRAEPLVPPPNTLSFVAKQVSAGSFRVARQWPWKGLESRSYRRRMRSALRLVAL
jgi:chorismate synthase